MCIIVAVNLNIFDTFVLPGVCLTPLEPKVIGEDELVRSEQIDERSLVKVVETYYVYSINFTGPADSSNVSLLTPSEVDVSTACMIKGFSGTNKARCSL